MCALSAIKAPIETDSMAHSLMAAFQATRQQSKGQGQIISKTDVISYLFGRTRIIDLPEKIC